MSRLALLFLLLLVAGAALRVVLRGIREGLTSGQPTSRTPVGGVPMVRDPVCGTYILRERALALGASSDPVYFCSARCRDEYRARSSNSRGQPQGRLA
jgi:hypothetical protein